MRMLLPAELALLSDWPKQRTSTEAFGLPAAWLSLGASLVIFMRLCTEVSHLQHHQYFGLDNSLWWGPVPCILGY